MKHNNVNVEALANFTSFGQRLRQLHHALQNTYSLLSASLTPKDTTTTTTTMGNGINSKEELSALLSQFSMLQAMYQRSFAELQLVSAGLQKSGSTLLLTPKQAPKDEKEHVIMETLLRTRYTQDLDLWESQVEACAQELKKKEVGEVERLKQEWDDNAEAAIKWMEESRKKLDAAAATVTSSKTKPKVKKELGSSGSSSSSSISSSEGEEEESSEEEEEEEEVQEESVKALEEQLHEMWLRYSNGPPLLSSTTS